jgi:uncharacterized protein YjdB
VKFFKRHRQRNCERLLRAVHELLEAYRCIHVATRITITLNKESIMSLVLTDTQQVVLSINPVDAKGNPGLLDGVPSWSSSDPSKLTVTPAVDGRSAVAAAVGPIGSATVNVVAVGGGNSLPASLDVSIVVGPIVSLKIEAGTPTEIVPLPTV